MRIIFLLITLFSFIYANGSLQIKKGWQLIGVPTSLNIKESFNNNNVEILWGYDALNQSWSGYSPIESKSIIIAEKYTTLTHLEPFQALWIFSKDDWELSYKQVESLNTPKNRTITIQTGWNLVAIPQQIVVSDKFFTDSLVWRYNQDEEWSVNDDSLDFPPIESIKQSEGLWVKSDELKEINIDDESSKLSSFKSRDSMLSYIRKMIEMNQYYYDYMIMDDIAVPMEESLGVATSVESSDSTKEASNATTTNLQESEVDESDILKHDGVHIFSVDNSNQKIIVTSFENISKQIYTPITNIDFTNRRINSIYLQNNRLVVFSNTLYSYSNKYDLEVLDQSTISQNENSLILDIFDVSDITSIKLKASHKVDGYYQDSRLIDGELYLISQFNPSIKYEYSKIYEDTVCTTIDREKTYVNCYGYSDISEPVEGISYANTSSDTVSIDVAKAPLNYEDNCEYSDEYLLWNKNNCYQYNYDDMGAWKYDYANPTIVSESLLPMIKSTISDSTTSTELVNHNSFYAPVKLNQQASITTISRFDIDTGEYKINSSFLGNTHTYYASLSSLYLVSNEYPLYYDYTHYKDQQMIYKFSFDENLSYDGRGFVEGSMLNQFSMSEKDNYLRVATTSGWSWWDGGAISNSVYTLKTVDEKLVVDGELTGLGKEGESIRAVRFMGDRGYVVTFKQTDPLYTLDMSDPKEPKVVGELSIPGFSTYLHPIDDNRILSIGRDADENGASLGLQFQLFDISDLSNPILADKIQIGDRYTYSEAEYNHKALSYRASDLMFAIPYRTYYGADYTQNEHFGIYQIDGLTIKSVDTLTSENSHWGDIGRGVIFDLNNTNYGALFEGSNIMCEDIK